MTVAPYPSGIPVQLAPDLTCVLAPNPSPMTYWGTNTYLVGQTQLAVIDPGPQSPSHLDAVLAAIDGRPVQHILLTHSHLDHSPLARPLAEAVGAPVLAFGDSQAGRSPVMVALARQGLTGGGEGIDHTFKPDVCLSDGEVVAGDWGHMTAFHTPGHIGNHLCFQWGDAVFTGDHVMGWASSLVSPPDGDLTDFMRSCTTLRAIPAQRYYPAHGAPIDDPIDRLDWLIAHRLSREAQLFGALTADPASVSQLTARIYTDVAASLLPAAERNVFAHLVDLVGRGLVDALPALAVDARFVRTAEKGMQ